MKKFLCVFLTAVMLMAMLPVAFTASADTREEICGAELWVDVPVNGLHWWTFLSAYMEIGDCTFAQIVRMRSLLAKGKKLEKHDREWYRANAHLVNMPVRLSQAEREFLAQRAGRKDGE